MKMNLGVLQKYTDNIKLSHMTQYIILGVRYKYLLDYDRNLRYLN